MRFIVQVFLALCGAIILLALGGCDQSSFQPGKNLHEAIFESRKKNDREEYDPTFGNETNYPIYDTGLWAEFRNNNLFWINNQAVVFDGFETGKYVHYDSKGPNKPKIIPMVWDIRRQEYYPLLDNNSKELRIKCKIGNQFYYSYGSRDKGYSFYFGEFELDGARYVLREAREKIEGDEIRDRSTGFCNKAPEERRFSNEKPTTYLFEIGGEIQHFPYADRAYFITDQHPAKIILPTRITDFTSLQYSEMLHAYHYTSRKSIQEEPVLGKILPLLKENGEPYLSADYYNILLFPNGRVEMLKFPEGPAGNVVEVFSVDWSKAGPVFQAYVEKEKSSEEKIRGLYLLLDGHYWLILKGVIGGTSVSPNGCHMAIDHFPRTGDSGWTENNMQTLKIIDFCSKGE